MYEHVKVAPWPEHLGLGAGCSITGIAVGFGLVAMVRPNGLLGVTTIVSSVMIIVGGIACGWALAARFLAEESVMPGWRALRFPVMYHFGKPLYQRPHRLSERESLAFTIEVLGQAGWLVLLPIDRLGRWFAGQVRG